MENEEQNERELDLFVLLEDFFKIGKRYWALLLVLVVVCSAGLTMYRRMKYQPKYEAYASFTVRVANPLQASAPGFNSDRKSTRLNSSHVRTSRMPSSA